MLSYDAFFSILLHDWFCKDHGMVNAYGPPSWCPLPENQTYQPCPEPASPELVEWVEPVEGLPALFL